MAETILGIVNGVKTIKSIALTVMILLWGNVAIYFLYELIQLDWWGCYVLTQFVGTSDTSQYFVGKNFGTIRPFAVTNYFCFFVNLIFHIQI